VILWRLTKRIWRRELWHEELWNGNRDRLWTHYFSRDSLYLWALQTYPRYRQQFTEMIVQPEYTHLRVLQFKEPRAAERWLAQLPVPGEELPG
jgi:hypothetical protein